MIETGQPLAQTKAERAREASRRRVVRRSLAGASPDARSFLRRRAHCVVVSHSAEVIATTSPSRTLSRVTPTTLRPFPGVAAACLTSTADRTSSRRLSRHRPAQQRGLGPEGEGGQGRPASPRPARRRRGPSRLRLPATGVAGRARHAPQRAGGRGGRARHRRPHRRRDAGGVVADGHRPAAEPRRHQERDREEVDPGARSKRPRQPALHGQGPRRLRRRPRRHRLGGDLGAWRRRCAT